MKKKLLVIAGLIFLVVLFIFSACEKENKNCSKEDLDTAVKAAFYAYGNVKITNSEGTDITSQFVGKKFMVMFNKRYCDGKSSDVFDQTYTLMADGSLNKDGIGYISFNMENFMDKIEMTSYLIIDAENTRKLGSTNAGYNVWSDGDVNAKMSIVFYASADNIVDWDTGNCTWEFEEF